jgi:choline kinase
VGITDIGIVVGYAKDQIIRHVATRYGTGRRDFSFIENPIFSKTNDIFSFWLTQAWLNEESFVCLNADVVFDSRILAAAHEAAAPILMVIDPTWRAESVKVIISGSKIVRMGTHIQQPDFSGTYAGITIFARTVHEKLFEKVKKQIQAGKENESFSEAVKQLADEGVQVGFTTTDGLPWAEIDDPGDLAFARLYVFPKLASFPAAA